MSDSESHVFYVVMYGEWFGFWTYSYTTWTRPRFKPRDYGGFVSKIRCHPLRLIRYMFASRKVELFKDQVLLCSSVLVPSSVSFCLSLSLTDTHTVEQGKIIDVKQLDPNKHSKWVSCRDTHVCNSWTHFVIVTVWWLIMPALGCHVYLWRRRHPRLAQIHVYTVAHGLDVSLQLVLSRHHDILDSTPEVANTFSLWQPLPSHVHLWRNSHPEVAQIHTYTHSVHIWLL